jgi:hypothetical protein
MLQTVASMSVFGCTDKLPIDQETLTLGRELIPACSFEDQDGNLDYHVSQIVRACFGEPKAANAAKELSEKFVRALAKDSGHARQYDQLANTLFEIHPEIALNAFFGGIDGSGRSALFRLSMVDETNGPVNRVPRELLLSWADKDKAARFPWLAGGIRLFDKGAEQGELRWSPVALYLLEHASDRSAVFRAFSHRIEPRSWSGSLAEVLTPYLQVVQVLLTHSDPTVQEWARKREQYLNERIAQERQQEQRIDARFE